MLKLNRPWFLKLSVYITHGKRKKPIFLSVKGQNYWILTFYSMQYIVHNIHNFM